MSEIRCSSCRIPVEAVPPRTAWKIANVAFWVAAMATAVVFSLILALNVVLVPIWFAIGAAVGASAGRAGSWSCPVCHQEIAVPAGFGREARHGGRLVPRHA